jgi:hypothetical protein
VSALNQRLRSRLKERLADVSRRDEGDPRRTVPRVPQPWRRRKLVLALLLVPVCLLASISFFELFFHATVRGEFWREEGFWFFSFGCLFWLSLGWFRVRPQVPYVFAHEFTHLLTAKLSGGKIHGWEVSEHGGFVETDKTSALITLSPYLVPLYTMMVFAFYGLIGLLADLHQLHEWHVFSWVLNFKWAWVFYLLAGATWCFHLTFTIEILGTEQSDLLHNGEFFSIVVIFLGNLAILGTLFISASPTVGWKDVARDAWHLLTNVWHWFF